MEPSQQHIPPTPPSESFAQIPVSQGYVANAVLEQKPKIFILVLVLFFFIAISYLVSSVSLLFMIVIFDLLINSPDVVTFSFFKYAPTMGLIPLILSFITLFFLYVGFKVKNGSPFSLKLGIISLVTIPLPFTVLFYFLMLPLLQMASPLENPSPLNFFIGNPSALLGNFAILISLFTLILLIFNKKQFHFQNTSLSNKAKIFLTVCATAIIIPTLFVVGQGYIKANDNDFCYTKAALEVAYHIYKPTPIPWGLTNATKFTTKKELAGKNNAVLISYETPITQQLNEKSGMIVLLKQVAVEPGFDLSGFLSKEVGSASQIETVPLSLSANQQTLFATKQLGHTLAYLSFVTTDNVLIFISTVNFSKEEILQFARSLR